MFTGIVEATGKVTEVGDGSLVVDSPLFAGTRVGDSISINGVCLTAVDVGGDSIRFDVVPETLSRTGLGSLGLGDLVNLERAMPATGRFDGHIVQGHVDGTGTVISLDEGDGGVVLTIAAPPQLMSHIAVKGSITVDGVSLTVAGIESDRFWVALIPHTLESTTLGSTEAGDTVNLETDVFAKYVERLLEARA